jgi:2-oxoacid:acceptor oxidoreductase delta subunit (pyruvate/2-ketoisovalerate family)
VGGLTGWRELASGGTVDPAEAPRPETGGWRTGVKPSADLSKCVNCLLCWLYCPDAAVLVENSVFTGFDLRYCKGCELCAEVCPEDAIAMVPDGD